MTSEAGCAWVNEAGEVCDIPEDSALHRGLNRGSTPHTYSMPAPTIRLVCRGYAPFRDDNGNLRCDCGWNERHGLPHPVVAAPVAAAGDAPESMDDLLVEVTAMVGGLIARLGDAADADDRAHLSRLVERVRAVRAPIAPAAGRLPIVEHSRIGLESWYPAREPGQTFAEFRAVRDHFLRDVAAFEAAVRRDEQEKAGVRLDWVRQSWNGIVFARDAAIGRAESAEASLVATEERLAALTKAYEALESAKKREYSTYADQRLAITFAAHAVVMAVGALLQSSTSPEEE